MVPKEKMDNIELEDSQLQGAWYPPKVAILGRPNVGKSTLFNIITDSRKAVVKNQPGVTRDIQIEPVEIWGKTFDIIDMGGVTEAHDLFSKLIREQVTEFLYSVNYIIVVMDGKSGLMPEDRDIIKIAKQTGKKMLLVVNKIDREHEADLKAAEFYEFGEDVVAASFEQRRGVSDVLEWITSQIPEQKKIEKDSVTLALVGKPNVGKSSLCNELLGMERMLVSETAGTTVDSIDSPFVYNNKRYTLVDTAGLRRSAKREKDIEIISAFKTQESIRKADIVLLLIDALIGPTEQDAKIMELILEGHKGVILVVNKSDLGGIEIPEFRKVIKEKIERVFHFFIDVSVVFTSAKNGTGIEELFKEIERMNEKINFRVGTSELNDFFFETIRKTPAPVWGNNNVKFYYLTQTYQKPPAFIAFANHPDGVTTAYRRFLIKHMKERWDLYGLPIRIFCMKSRNAK